MVEGNTALAVAFEDGQDLNGDGDMSDRVVHIVDGATGTAWNSGLAVRSSTYVYDLSEDFAAVLVNELSMGDVDLDGNGSTNDDVLHLLRW